MPAKKTKKRVLLFVLISLLLLSSIVLSYLIYEKEQATPPAEIAVLEAKPVEPPVEAKPREAKPVANVPVIQPKVRAAEVSPAIAPEVTEQKNSVLTSVDTPKPPSEVATKVVPKSLAVSKPLPEIPATLPVVAVTAPVLTKNETLPKAPQKMQHIREPKKEDTPYLEIKKSVLSPGQLADIHLKNAHKAQLKGDRASAAQLRMRALQQQPQLHDVRQSLALYYYGINEQKQAVSLLQKGALQFPEHADFNLMLARIALKSGEAENAYFYLHQAPPDIVGNLDYHVSYAILAQKFQHYAQAEKLYLGLLSQQPNNGRWLMSLAIAQDKQGKEALAVQSYQRALLQVDLSSNAKKYINQRLTYLAKQQG